MRRFQKIKKWYKKYKLLFYILLALIVFPLIVGGLYALPLPQIINVDSGALLAYYGTAFGILGSFVIYRGEINKKKGERNQELKPIFYVEAILIDNDLGLFRIDIKNHSENPLTYLYFYDEFVSTLAKKEYSFNVVFNKSFEKKENDKVQFNITMDPDIIDSDGYPKYIQLICDDKDGNAWNSCYYKVNDCGKIFFYPREIEII